MTRDPVVDHVLLTRFNLPTSGVEGLIRAREGWLHDRVELFERYCAPSVARQTRPVTWIVYFDPDSPRWLLERLKPLAATGLFRPVLRTRVGPDDLLNDLRQAVPEPADMLLTTNLDNDDGLADDFAERLRTISSPQPKVAVYLIRGLIKSDQGVFLRTDRRNAFCSVREPWSEAKTAWAEYHNEFARSMPVIELGGPPSWLQVVHGANVSNRVRGRLVSPVTYGRRFGDLLDDAPVPNSSELVRDILVSVPARSTRDGARAAIRTVALRFLGKDRYQEIKLRLSLTRARR